MSNVFVFYLLYKKKKCCTVECVVKYVFIIIKNNKLHEYIYIYIYIIYALYNFKLN